ncbi:heme oxygenase-like, multi-helical [Moelleriella libera RCEF 2490]|uniref:Heme oxygenase-like, multi-helical n=1 Tax=Moelleriella libera RCEF 2490 TaxID=1081109 RepID=A0A166PL41_9HYPO|nr:heme oxygenase-like, multi-helical [Moelleriella libera RCEF 2490]
MFVLQIIVAVLLAFVAIAACQIFVSRFAAENKRKEHTSRVAADSTSQTNAVRSTVSTLRLGDEEEAEEEEEEEAHEREQEMNTNKNLYYKLHNLEQHPDVLPACWNHLVTLLSETLSGALAKPAGTILDVRDFSTERLASFLRAKDAAAIRQWRAYLARRARGDPRELFGSVAEAKWWLKQAAPVKFVDGAWLGHVHRITTPFALRNITKNAWQVLSEELGDGDADKNHVKIYQDLMRDIDVHLPEAFSRDFIHARHGLDAPRVWKAAVAQLLISLFPHDFLPEILGFNMAYESLTPHLLKSARELRELKLSAYYFSLHISIDNADSGHAAMAAAAVAEYIEQMLLEAGDEAASMAWRRVQAGYILAEGLPTTPETPTMKQQHSRYRPRTCWTAEETAVAKIFAAKATIGHGIHCRSALLRFGDHTLSEWLDPRVFGSEAHQKTFLCVLSNSRPWVIRGNSKESRLIRELSWEGSMFGSFTQVEVETVKRWIDSLAVRESASQVYWDFLGCRSRGPEALYFSGYDGILFRGHPVFDGSCPTLVSIRGLEPAVRDVDDAEWDRICQRFQPNTSSAGNAAGLTDQSLAGLLPLWFAGQSVLESFVSLPARVSSRAGALIVKALRAQYGYGPEGPGVAGMDEIRRTGAGQAIGLVEIGLQLWRNAGKRSRDDVSEAPRNLGDAIAGLRGETPDPVRHLARDLLSLSMRPLEYHDVLIGLAWAFMELHEMVAASGAGILGDESQTRLAEIAARERRALEALTDESYAGETKSRRQLDFLSGRSLGRSQIAYCMNTACR